MSASRERDPKAPRPIDIAQQGRAAAARKANTTFEKIRRAKKAIVADLEKNNGIYPYEGGRLTVAEVLRRAGLDRALLQKPRHENLKLDINEWLATIKKMQLKGKTVVRRAVTQRAQAAEDELALIRQRWAEAELEFVEQANEIARLRRRCAELEKQTSLVGNNDPTNAS